jgi:enoyl-CoA hydratase
MQYQFLKIKKLAGLSLILLSRPEVMNALSPALLRELKTAILECGHDPEIRVVALSGAGKAFSAGADLNSLELPKLKNGRVGEEIDRAANEAIQAIVNLPKVVIAAVNGHCYTGALEIVLACDLAIASESARFGDTHARWGIRPSWGMSQRLPRRVGLIKAKELSFTAKIITAREAETIGLVNAVVPDERLEPALAELAASIMANSLEAVSAYKQLFNRGEMLTLAQGLEEEARSEFSIDDTRFRIMEFFKNK